MRGSSSRSSPPRGPPQGTGLGLSTVYGIVKQSQGFIWVYSEVGQGTCFKVYLQAGGRADDRRAGRAGRGVGFGNRDRSPRRGQRRPPQIWRSRFLTPAGYTVLSAGNGEEALRVAQAWAGPIHLLLTDVVMPGMSGRQLAERLVQVRPGTRILYMSGYTNDTVIRHGALDAKVPFLNKPFGATELLRKVREALDTPR